MPNVHTSSVATQPRGTQGLFANPCRGFCFPAALSSLGEPEACPLLPLCGFSLGSLLSLGTVASRKQGLGLPVWPT